MAEGYVPRVRTDTTRWLPRSSCSKASFCHSLSPAKTNKSAAVYIPSGVKPGVTLAVNVKGFVLSTSASSIGAVATGCLPSAGSQKKSVCPPQRKSITPSLTCTPPAAPLSARVNTMCQTGGCNRHTAPSMRYAPRLPQQHPRQHSRFPYSPWRRSPQGQNSAQQGAIHKSLFHRLFLMIWFIFAKGKFRPPVSQFSFYLNFSLLLRCKDGRKPRDAQ